MVWRFVLLLAVVVPGAAAVTAADVECSSAARAAGLCTLDAENDGRQVDLIGELSGGGGGNPTDGGSSPGTVPDIATPPQGEPAAGPVDDPLRWDWNVTDPPEITLADLASFVPATGSAAGEPAGWGIVGLQTNFYADTGVQVLDGELLGEPASVRFTPVAWHWDYGDGSRATTATPGAPWAGDAEFEETPTSHRYDAADTYEVRLTVEFGAEFRFAGNDWLPVAGTVTAGAEPLSVRIGTADTVLVGRGCEAGSGPGC